MKLYDKNNKIGRPKGSKKQTESMHSVGLKLTESMHNRISFLTKESGNTITGYIREAILQKLRLDELALKHMGIDIKK